MANRRVRVVRWLKIDGKAVFCAPDTTPKGAISSEFVIYKGRKLKFPPAEGRWYLRWEEGSKPKWQRCDSFSDARKRKGLVFPTRNGKPNGKHRVALTRVAKRAGLDESRFWLHKFRATAATTWLRGGIDIRTVQSLLGHTDLASTMRYLKPMAGSDLHKKMNGLYAAAASAGI